MNVGSGLTSLQIIGNVLSGIGLLLFFISSIVRYKKNILLLQTGNHIFGFVAEVCIAQYSGAVQEVVSICRNILILFHKNNKITSIFFIVLGVALGVTFNIFFNGNNPWGYLPVFAAFEFSVIILIPNIKEYWIKIAMCVSTVCWGIYGFKFKNYVMLGANVITFISSFISIFLYFHKQKKILIEDENNS